MSNFQSATDSPKLAVNKLKSVTFPENTLVTILPMLSVNSPSERSDPSLEKQDTDITLKSVERSLHTSPILLNGNEDNSESGALTNNDSHVSANNSVEHENLSKIKASDDVEGNDVFARILDRKDSASTFFHKLRETDLKDAGSIGVDTAACGWKSPNNYLAEEAVYNSKEQFEASYGEARLKPIEVTEFSTSAERRYSAVVHQFMKKNGLVSPQADSLVLSRQADQATDSEPSYVRWATFDQDPIGPTEVAREPDSLSTFTGSNQKTPDAYTPGSTVPLSGESFQLKSIFPTNNMSKYTPEPMSTLAEVDDSGSLHAAQGLTHGMTRAHSAKASSSLSYSDSSHLKTPRSETTLGRLSVPSFLSRRQQCFALGSDNDSDDGKKSGRIRRLGIALFFLGFIIMISSLIGLLVNLFG